MRFTVSTTTTVDVSLRDPVTLYRALKNNDTERLKDVVTLVDFDFDFTRGDDN